MAADNTYLVYNPAGTFEKHVDGVLVEEDTLAEKNIHIDTRFGDTTNFLKVAQSNGQMSWEGTYLKKLTLRPGLVEKSSKAGGTPTQVYRGLNVGYSLPIWSTPTNADEELYWRQRIPLRWDGTTDPQLGICVTLAAGEDVGDKFKLQLEWQTTNAGNEMGTTTSSITSEQTILTGRNAAYDTYFVFFNFNADDVNNPITIGEMIQARVRRIAASANEATGEIIVWDWVSMWAVNKVYGVWSVDVNAT